MGSPAFSPAHESLYDGPAFFFLDVEFEEMSQLYSNLGIIHLFALSGMQVAFFLDAFRRFFLRLGLEQGKGCLPPLSVSFFMLG